MIHYRAAKPPRPGHDRFYWPQTAKAIDGERVVRKVVSLSAAHLVKVGSGKTNCGRELPASSRRIDDPFNLPAHLCLKCHRRGEWGSKIVKSPPPPSPEFPAEALEVE